MQSILRQLSLAGLLTCKLINPLVNRIDLSREFTWSEEYVSHQLGLLVGQGSFMRTQSQPQSRTARTR